MIVCAAFNSEKRFVLVFGALSCPAAINAAMVSCVLRIAW